MAIRIKQIGRIANQVINTYLQNGAVPSIRSVISGIYTILKTRTSGNPLTIFTPIIASSLTQPDVSSVLVNTIQGDIQDLYNENIDLVNRIIRDFDYKLTYRERLAQRIVDISSSLVNKTSVIRGTIDSFKDIDIANTTAFINFRDYTVELLPLSNRTKKIDLSNANITFNSDGQTILTLGQIKDITQDFFNNAFFIQTTTKSLSSYLEINISLAVAVNISKIVITTHTGTSIRANLEVDTQVLPSQLIDITRRAVWNFASSNTQNVKIRLIKSIPDSGNVYNFGIKDVSLYSEEYSRTAVFTTTPLEFMNLPLGTIGLSSMQDTPPNTSINWSLSVNGTNGPFFSITQGKNITFSSASIIDDKRVMPVRTLRDPVNVITHTSNLSDTGLSVLAPIRGGYCPLFSLCRIDKTVTYGSSIINRGRNAWNVNAYHYNVDSTSSISDPQPSLSDFIDPRGTNPIVYTRFQPTEYDLSNQYGYLSNNLASALRLPAIEYPIQSETDRVMHLFEAYLTVDPTLAPSILNGLKQQFITLPSILATPLRTSIYVNGKSLSVTSQLIAGSIQYGITLPFTPGLNTIQIVTNNYTALSGGSFDFGSYTFGDLCKDNGKITWYAQNGPMTEVVLFELQYQTGRNDFSRYSLVQDPTGDNQLIVVRELPTTVYDITTVGRNPTGIPSTVILQATLHGSDVEPSLTPRILSYDLTNTL